VCILPNSPISGVVVATITNTIYSRARDLRKSSSLVKTIREVTDRSAPTEVKWSQPARSLSLLLFLLLSRSLGLLVRLSRRPRGLWGNLSLRRPASTCRDCGRRLRIAADAVWFRQSRRVTDGRTDGHAATADNYNDVDDIWNSLPERNHDFIVC